VQVVYVAGTTNAHAESSKLALNNGKHVLCEKAFAMNLRETREVLDLAKKKGLFVMEVLHTGYCAWLSNNGFQFPMHSKKLNFINGF
jgi:predicted dehydrogenase